MKLDTIVKAVDLVDKILRAALAVSDARQKKIDDEKDRKIRELEEENKRLKEAPKK
jgi:hypothetical protein